MRFLWTLITTVHLFCLPSSSEFDPKRQYHTTKGCVSKRQSYKTAVGVYACARAACLVSACVRGEVCVCWGGGGDGGARVRAICACARSCVHARACVSVCVRVTVIKLC